MPPVFPNPTHKLTPEQQYEFDLRGYIVLRNHYDADIVAQLHDGIDELLALLQEEHKEDDDHCAALLTPLRVLAKGGQPANATEFVALALGFAHFQRRHLGWENGTNLPLAERRLTDADQAELGRSMAARRGIEFPEKT